MNELNKILLRRKHKILLDKSFIAYEQTREEKTLLMAMLKNFEYLGFSFSQELFEEVSKYNRVSLEELYFELLPAIKELVGADVEYNPMYPNFPNQISEMQDIELLFNAFIHYMSGGKILPEYQKDDRLPLIDDNKTTVLSIGTHGDLMRIFKNLVKSKTSLSTQDKEDISTIIKNCTDYVLYLPDEIPLKENVALIGKLVIEESPVKSIKAISKYFHTATDVLRLITALSDGDISLAKNTRYRKLKRYERRMILDLLANCGDITEDLFRYKYRWIRIAEILHPFEYQYPRYKTLNQAFNTLRNEKKPLMFSGKVQAEILRKDMKSAANLLKYRPGEFARKLDKVIRDSDDPNYILNCFESISTGISSPVLIQVRQHFIGRMSETPNPIRVFFPKGNLAKAISIKNELPDIDKTISQNVIRICTDALIKKYREKEPLGKVYIDNDFKNYLVPFSQRSVSSSSKSVIRGSRLSIKRDASVVRAFIWWTNTKENERVDIDLSAAIFDSDWKFS